MRIGDEDGFLRPDVSPAGPRLDSERDFSKVCPGVSLSAPRDARPLNHPEFGGYHAAWRAWARDDTVRHSGSSGGVLTAISGWLLTSSNVSSVAASTADPVAPTRTRSVDATTVEEILLAAGSRYAPVENVTTWAARSDAALVGKPCEISAARKLSQLPGADDAPPLLSFFCAGTPSQLATDQLVIKLGAAPAEVTSLRYRGNGWPGDFTVSSEDGDTQAMSYKESWGGNLGRSLQWRCKTCVDGTGGDADISVGDYWKVDQNGYPDFSEGAGESVMIARTAKGLRLVLEAEAAGVIEMHPIHLDAVAGIQPLQVQRRRLLSGRLAGRLMSGKPGPRYRGYGLAGHAFRHPIQNLRASVGTWLRSRSGGT
ncbi:Coenzyme F420 hydrogenase/dehydrogenase, beta subunit C-terminal domain [Aeromicrobium fastidiosum]|nr:Coenzyme F420 hydrogenase/dehydrogenase, beta subunit C-terminal domain [Aeromicrobium fastidiosum]